MIMYKLFLPLVLLTTLVQLSHAEIFESLKGRHSPGELTDSDLFRIAGLYDEQQLLEDMNKILVPRVVGSKGHNNVYNYIKNTLKDLGYHVEIDEFVDNTPFGNLTFKNIIATLNPEAERFFVVAAHYDSKYFNEGEFIGATDSAVPCGMILQMARVFKKFNFPKSNEVSLKLIFFDGEEAFVQWGPKDSLYGARHLADKLDRGRSVSKLTGEMVTDLQRIDCLMLLDLLGHASPRIYNYFPNTKVWFNRLSGVEKTLFDLRRLQKRTSYPYFHRSARNAFIEDDHIPFMSRGVPILHIIPLPFPDVWHTLNDNADGLDSVAIHDLSLIFQVFVAKYLHA